MNVACPECRSVFRVDPSKLPASIVRARCAVCGGLITITPSSTVRDEFAPRSTTDRPASTGSTPGDVGARPAAPAYARASASPDPASTGLTVSAAAPAPPPMSQAAPLMARPAAPPPPAPAPSPFTTGTAAAAAGAPGGMASQMQRPDQSARPPAGGAPTNLGGATAAALLGRADAQPAAGPAAARPPGTVPPRAPSPARPAMPFVRPGTAAPPPAAQQGATPFGVRATPPAAQGAPRRPINPFLANDPNAKARRLARALISDMVTYFPEKREEGLRNGTLKQLFEEEITKSYGEYVEQVGREFAESTPFFQEALNEILAGGRKLF